MLGLKSIPKLQATPRILNIGMNLRISTSDLVRVHYTEPVSKYKKFTVYPCHVRSLIA